MGFDIMGVNATSETGEYFRNSVWGWRPLQLLIATVCELTEKQNNNLGFNNGYHYTKATANKIASKLEAVLQDENTIKKLHKEIMDALGSMYKYSLKEFKENTANFIAFAKDSGGFDIY